ncbi:MAG TPA: aspartyl protease family protein [Thermoanaerobaculia bacterium]|nr:aspartyl protease family protein [Thermoanaerobaculia bacterium]
MNRISRSPVFHILLLVVFLAPASRAQLPEPAGVLARVKEAAGGSAWDAVRTLHIRARVATSGLAGPAESWDDVLTGRFLDTYTLGPVSGAEGYDGKTSWSQDTSGQTLANDGGDAREGTADEAYRRSRSYWYPGRRSGTVQDAGERTDGGRSFHVLTFQPAGGRPFEMWIDATTFRVDRIVEKTARDTRTTFFSDYRKVNGLEFAFAEHTTNGEAKYDQTVTLESVEVNPPLDEARFRRPEGRTSDFAVASGATSAQLPFRLLNNHLFVEGRMDGKGPLHLLFDTGGANILTPETARRLGLSSQGSLQGRGVGEKSEDVGLTKVKELTLGGIVLRDQMFAVYPLSSLAAVEGVEVDGVVGYEVLKRFVARIDYAGGVIALVLPAAFQPPPGAAAVPFTFDGQTPQVEGEIDGIPGRFTLDTGSRSSLTVNRPFAEEHGLAAKYGAKLEALSGWGVGGGVRSLFARAKVLELGSVEVPGPVVDLAQSQKGAFANRYLAGNVGGGVLRRFTVTFDYGKQIVYLEPNANFAQRDEYDKAGMWLNRKGEAFEVMDVTAGGPAAAAGLKVGDALLAVDGKSAKEILLPDLRTRLKATGTVRLTVKSGGRTREVAVELRDLV